MGGYRPKTFWTLQLLGWGGFYLAMALSRVGRYPLPYMLMVMAILTVLGVIASLGLRLALDRLGTASASLGVQVVGCVITAYVLAGLWTFTFALAMLAIDRVSWFGPGPITSVIYLFDGTVYNAFALVAWGFLYIGLRYYHSLQEAREHSLRAEALATDARLRALEAQLHPHFLFNTLNAISTLVVEQRNTQATRMISRLSDLLRNTLQHRDRHEVTLTEELAVVETYLAIESERFGERLRVVVDVVSEVARARIPFMLLQPLVENAVRHGIAKCPAGGVVTITAHRRDAWLDLMVSNTTTPIALTITTGSGVGLTNVRERLAMLYPGRHELLAEQISGGEFVVRITLPWSAAISDASP